MLVSVIARYVTHAFSKIKKKYENNVPIILSLVYF